MHIMIISTYGFDPAFPSRPEYVLAHAFAAQGHTVSAIEYAHNPQLPATQQLLPNLTIYRCRTFGFFSYDLWQLARTLPQPDVIHVQHLRHLLAYQAQWHWRGRVPMVQTPQGMLHSADLAVDRERPLEHPLTPEKLIMTPAQLWSALRRGQHPRRSIRNYLIHAPLRRFDGIFATSHHEKGVLIDLGIPAERIDVVANPVELAQYFEAPPRPRTAHPMILFIGQLVPRKGWDLAVQALPAVLARHPDAQLVMVTHNSSQMQALNEMAQSLGISAHISVRKSIDETSKIQLLQEAHVLIAPSRYEGFGIPPIEAMAAQCPVVTTDCPACNEIVHHEQTGLLVAYNDVAGYAQAIIRLLDDAHLRQTLVSNGLAHAKTHFTPDVVATHTISCYEKHMR